MGFPQSGIGKDEEGVVRGGAYGRLGDHLTGKAGKLIALALDEVVEIEGLDKVARNIAHFKPGDDIGIRKAHSLSIRVVNQLLRRVLCLDGRIGRKREGDILLLVGLLSHGNGVHQFAVVAKLLLDHRLQKPLSVLLQPLVKGIGRQTDSQDTIFQRNGMDRDEPLLKQCFWNIILDKHQTLLPNLLVILNRLCCHYALCKK